jgi:hypothetical protein
VNASCFETVSALELSVLEIGREKSGRQIDVRLSPQADQQALLLE